jgi:hypothetical protein
MIKILGLFRQIAFKNFTLLHIITSNYAQLRKKNKRYSLHIVTSNYG